MTDPTPLPPRIFEHVSRKEWGRAVLFLEIADKRTFLFENGTEKSFRPDYWHKMEATDLEPDEAYRIDRAARRNQAPAPGSTKTKAPPKKPAITFDQQLAYFLETYPLGFDDDTYIKTERGEEGVKGSEKLKNAAIERAKELLSKERLEGLLEEGDFATIHETAFEILTSTKNTTLKMEATRFRDASEDSHENVAKNLFNILYGEEAFSARFDKFVSSMRMEKGATWPVATLFGALAHPHEQIFVKPTFMKKQALILDIDPRYDTMPNATTYAQFLEAAKATEVVLKKAGQAPRDLLDVYTFIWRTLSPKAIKAATGVSDD